MNDVLLLADELVDDACPLHADLEVGDLTALTDDQRRWLEVFACPELHMMFDFVRKCQLRLQDELPDHKRAAAKEQMRIGTQRIDRLREQMRRLIAGEPEPKNDRPHIELWDR